MGLDEWKKQVVGSYMEALKGKGKLDGYTVRELAEMFSKEVNHSNSTELIAYIIEKNKELRTRSKIPSCYMY